MRIQNMPLRGARLCCLAVRTIFAGVVLCAAAVNPEAFNRDGALLAADSADPAIRIWDMATVHTFSGRFGLISN